MGSLKLQYKHLIELRAEKLFSINIEPFLILAQGRVTKMAPAVLMAEISDQKRCLDSKLRNFNFGP